MSRRRRTTRPRGWLSGYRTRELAPAIRPSDKARGWALVLLAFIALLWSSAVFATFAGCGDNEFPRTDAGAEVDAAPGPLPAVQACCWNLLSGRDAVQACLERNTSPGDGCRWLTCDLVFDSLHFKACR